MKAMKQTKVRLFLAVLCLGLVFSVGLPGCLETSELQCIGGTVECNVTCVYLNADPANCGACGNACQPNADCFPTADGGGVCLCPATLSLCGGSCSDVTTDPNNCGLGCAGDGGVVCAAGEVCKPTPGLGGVCQTSCGTAVECNGACVTLTTDPNNCGACGNVCNQGYSCHPTPNGTLTGTCLPDAVVSCSTAGSGVVTPIFDSPYQPVVGPGVAVGTAPAGLAILGSSLLVGVIGPLGEVSLQNLAIAAPAETPAFSGPDFVEVDSTSLSADGGSWVYVVDGSLNTLTIFNGPAPAAAQVLLPDGGVQALGLSVAGDGGYAFGPGAVPEPYARVADEIFVPLFVPGTVVRLDVSDPNNPRYVNGYDLTTVNLQPFVDGGTAFPYPSQALFHNGLVYVVLNNLDENFAPAGPSMLVEINPTLPADGGAGGISTVVPLDSSVCLNAVTMVEAAGQLLVSCFGAVQYNADFSAVLSVDRSAVLLLDVNDALLSSWSPQCRADAGASCTPPIAASTALVNGRAYVGDQSGGRVFVLGIGAEGQLTQIVGYGADGGVPLQPCPVGFSSVTGIVRVP